jgi:hypothetical protein
MDRNDRQRPSRWDRTMTALYAAAAILRSTAALVTALQGCGHA